MQQLQNKQSEETLMGGAVSAPSVTSCSASAAGDSSSMLRRRCRRTRSDDANGGDGTAVRTDRNKAETRGRTCKVFAGSALGRWPNTALQRIAARWRFCWSRKVASGPLALRAGVRPLQ
jgi:hypothetical protein